MTESLSWEPIDTLIPHPENPRSGDIGAISESIGAHGFITAVTVQRGTRHILAGNHRVLAAKALGQTEVPVVWADVDDDHALQFLIADNRTNDLATWNFPDLGDLLSGLAERGKLEGTGYDGDALDELLADLAQPPVVHGNPDEVPVPPEEPVTKLGDLWLLGPHRVLCGDAFIDLAGFVAGIEIDVVLTHPPYGMNLDTDYAKIGKGTPKGAVVLGKTYRQVIGDDHDFDAAPFMVFFQKVPEQFWFGADYYRTTVASGGSWLVWDKRVEGLEEAIGGAFELCWTKAKHQRRILRYLWSGYTARERNEPRSHPTQKPIGLLAEILELWTPGECTVIDPFAGSGSTLIAAQQTGRTAYLLELDPAYCDVICARFQALTGTKPILESTGEPHDFHG